MYIHMCMRMQTYSNSARGGEAHCAVASSFGAMRLAIACPKYIIVRIRLNSVRNDTSTYMHVWGSMNTESIQINKCITVPTGEHRNSLPMPTFVLDSTAGASTTEFVAAASLFWVNFDANLLQDVPSMSSERNAPCGLSENARCVCFRVNLMAWFMDIPHLLLLARTALGVELDTNCEQKFAHTCWRTSCLRNYHGVLLARMRSGDTGVALSVVEGFGSRPMERWKKRGMIMHVWGYKGGARCWARVQMTRHVNMSRDACGGACSWCISMQLNEL